MALPVGRICVALAAVAGLLAGCAGPPPAPVVDRSSGYRATPDGFYRVRRGDTLYAIAFRYGLDWRDVARWNGIAAPYLIYPDQLLRLNSPASGRATHAREAASPGAAAVSTRPAAGASGATTRPLESPRASTRTAETSPRATPSEPAAGPEAPPPVVSATPDSSSAVTPDSGPAVMPATVPGSDPDRWLWPARGRIANRFVPGDPSRKGIDIAGEVGDPVLASADGVVVYSGSGLIGYGELIIVKHSDRMLSAYAHNHRRLVGEGERVSAGSQIAEMGTNDRSQAVLHFEIRVNGKPEDPLRYLPSR